MNLTLVATEQQRRDLAAHGFANVVLWSRGVDTELFRPVDRNFLDFPRPIFAYIGRVAVEKNLDAFLALDRDGCRREADAWTWERASAQFLSYLVPVRASQSLAATAP